MPSEISGTKGRPQKTAGKAENEMPPSEAREHEKARVTFSGGLQRPKRLGVASVRAVTANSTSQRPQEETTRGTPGPAIPSPSEDGPSASNPPASKKSAGAREAGRDGKKGTPFFPRRILNDFVLDVLEIVEFY